MKLILTIALALSATAALADPLPQPTPPIVWPAPDAHGIVWPDRPDAQGICPVGWRAGVGDYCFSPGNGTRMRLRKRYMKFAPL